MITRTAIILADAESTILPAILLVAVLYPTSILVLLMSLKGSRSNWLAVTAGVIVAGSGFALVAVFKDLSWPLDSGSIISLLFWLFPFLCGVFVLIRGLRRLGTNKRKVL